MSARRDPAPAATIGARAPIAARKPGQTVVPGWPAVTSAASAAIVFPAPPRADVLRCWAKTPRGRDRSAGRSPPGGQRGVERGKVGEVRGWGVQEEPGVVGAGRA
jgi:hypothetical protein